MRCILYSHKPQTVSPDHGPHKGQTATVCTECGKVLRVIETRKEWRSGYRDYEVAQ